MKATDLLKKQHRQVKGLFKQIAKTDSSRGRRELMEQVADALTLHTRLEEDVFYPAVAGLGSSKAREMVRESIEEHHVVDLVLAELPKVDPDEERFEAKMTVLSELIEHHVEEEEREMFKLARKLGDAELKALGERMAEQADHLGRQRRAA